MMKYFALLKSAALAAFIFASAAQANNLHLIEKDDRSGFAIYRSGVPFAKEMEEYCRQGITEMMVLDGSAASHEVRYQKNCPTLKVIYNVDQSDKIPVTPEFLAYFDQWVESAKAEGRKIAFRCTCGCHRTGRLAAYYRMKYNAFDVDEALEEMNRLGKFMVFYKHLWPQVRALEDFVRERPCTQEKPYCVK